MEGDTNLPPTARSSTGTPEPLDGWRELALKLLALQFPMTPEGSELRLLPGALPPDLPFGLPIPQGGRLVGTTLAGEPTIVLNIALAPDRVIEYFRAELGRQGWQMADALMGPNEVAWCTAAAGSATGRS